MAGKSLVVTDGEHLYEVTDSKRFFEETTVEEAEALYAQLYLYVRTIEMLEMLVKKDILYREGELDSLVDARYSLTYFKDKFTNVDFDKVEEECDKEFSAVKMDLI